VSNVYNVAKKNLMSGALDLSTAPLRVLLLQAGYVYNPDHLHVSDLTPATNELSVAGYARQALTGLAVSQDDVNDRAEAVASQVSFGALAAGETVASAVVFDDTNATDATRELVAFYSLGSVPTNGGTVSLRFGGADPGAIARLNDA